MEYPLQGVRLSALQEYFRTACDIQGLNPLELTTAEFCSKIVLKDTAKSQTALIERFDPIKDVRQQATVFVSHAVSDIFDIIIFKKVFSHNVCIHETKDVKLYNNTVVRTGPRNIASR